jgi:DNA-binding CsgD family transcriptional regulator
MRDLVDALMDTVDRPSSWVEALAELCAFTGATRALVSLRDLGTAEIYVPSEVAETHGSPLIHGFAPEEVEAYVTDYIFDDPWTAIEARHPPVRPYAMSSHLPPERLRETRFWTWLEPLGIGDAIACEIGATDLHRTLLNLYLPLDAPPGHAAEAVAKLETVLPLVRKAWAVGRRFQIHGLSKDGLERLLDALSHPALVATCAGTVEASNAPARARFAGWGIDLAPGAPFRLPDWMPVETEPGLDPLPVERLACAPEADLVAAIRTYAASELFHGEPVRRVLVTLDPAAPPPLWAAPELTEREGELVRLLCEGRTHKAAAFEMERSYPRIMQLWRSARGKLGVTDISDLRVRHRLRTLRE